MVWIARYRFYHDRWAYARTKEAPTWWLDHPVSIHDHDLATFPRWREPTRIPTIAWASWITWTESRSTSDSPLDPPPSIDHTSDTDDSDDNYTAFHHSFYSSAIQPLPHSPASPRVMDLPRQPAFTAAYRLAYSPFTSWLTDSLHPYPDNLSLPLPSSRPFIFTIPNTDPPITISGSLPLYTHDRDPVIYCTIALAFDHAIAHALPPHISSLPDSSLAFLWDKYVLAQDDLQTSFRATYALLTTPTRYITPTALPSFHDIRAAFISSRWSDGATLNLGDCLRDTLRNPPRISRHSPIDLFSARYYTLAAFAHVLPGHFEQDLSHHALVTAFINAFPGHFRNAFSLAHPQPRFDIPLSDITRFFCSYETTIPSHYNPRPRLFQPHTDARVIDHVSLRHLIQALSDQPRPLLDSFTGSYSALIHPVTRLITSGPPTPQPHPAHDSDDDSLFDSPSS